MDDKKEFVENELKNILVKADSSIKDVRYAVDKALDIVYMEAVYIEYKNGYKRKINVTGDSNLAIFYDVSRSLLNPIKEKIKRR